MSTCVMPAQHINIDDLYQSNRILGFLGTFSFSLETVLRGVMCRLSSSILLSRST